MATTVTVRGATVAAAPAPAPPGSAAGNTQGAQALLATLTPGGKVPASWQHVSAAAVAEDHAPYTVTHQAAGNSSGTGRITWQETISAGVGIPGVNVPIPGSTHTVTREWDFSWTSDGTVTNSHDNTTSGGQNNGTYGFWGTLFGWADALGGILSALLSGAFWRAVGIGALGVGLGVVGIVLLYKSSGQTN